MHLRKIFTTLIIKWKWKRRLYYMTFTVTYLIRNIYTSAIDITKTLNRNYSAILATLQITSYALDVYIAVLFTCQLHESLIKLYFKQFSIFLLKF